MADAEVVKLEGAGNAESVPDRPIRRLLPDPALIWAIFRRRLWPFVLTFVAVLALVAYYNLKKEALYSAMATVVIEPRKMNVTEGNSVLSDLPADTNVVDTEVQILSSPGLASRVASKLHIEQYPEFGGGRPIDVPPSGPGLHPLARALLGHVQVQRQGLSLVIAINAISGDPKLAALIANTFAQEYISQQEESKNSATHNASQFLQKRLEQMRIEVNAADAALQRYKVAHGLMSAQGSTMAEQEVSTLNQQISQARADAAEKLGRLNAARAQIARGGGGADVGAALQSSTVSELRGKEGEATRILADLTSRYGELHPDVQKQRLQLADIRQQLKIEINRVISSLAADSAASQSRLNSLLASQARARGVLAGNNSAQVGYLELERRAEAARTIYNAFLNRSKETMSQEGLMQPDARVVSLARVPNLPFSPNLGLALVFGLIGATIAGCLAVGIAEYLDGGIRTKLDVERRLRVRYLGAIPELGSTLGRFKNVPAPEDYILDHPMSAFAEAVRSLRANLAGRSGRTPRVVALTSALPREGKSTTSIAIARVIAEAGTRVVLVDCDIRRRSSSSALLPEGHTGLIDYVAGKLPLSEAVMKDPRTELHVLGTTVAPTQIGSLFGERQLESVLDELKAAYDVVILDTAPLLGIAESRILASAADATILLARWKSTSVAAADAAVEILLDANVKLRGVALTLVDIRKYASTGPGEMYSYHKKFSGYYAN